MYGWCSISDLCMHSYHAGGYPVGGGSYATTAPPTAPLPQQYAAQPSPQQYPAQPKQASPPAFDPSAYSGGYDQQAFSTSYQAPAQPQVSSGRCHGLAGWLSSAVKALWMTCS